MMSVIMILITFLVGSIIFSFAKTVNPMKTVLMMCFVLTLITILLFLFTGSSFMPLIHYLLIMGGLLVVFMIMSAVSPNENMKKMKILWMFPLIFSISGFTYFKENFMPMNTFLMVKLNLLTTSMMILSTILISIYFFCFLKMLEKEKSAMRSSI